MLRGQFFSIMNRKDHAAAQSFVANLLCILQKKPRQPPAPKFQKSQRLHATARPAPPILFTSPPSAPQSTPSPPEHTPPFYFDPFHRRSKSAIASAAAFTLSLVLALSTPESQSFWTEDAVVASR